MEREEVERNTVALKYIRLLKSYNFSIVHVLASALLAISVAIVASLSTEYINGRMVITPLSVVIFVALLAVLKMPRRGSRAITRLAYTWPVLLTAGILNVGVFFWNFIVSIPSPSPLLLLLAFLPFFGLWQIVVSAINLRTKAGLIVKLQTSLEQDSVILDRMRDAMAEAEEESGSAGSLKVLVNGKQCSLRFFGDWALLLGKSADETYIFRPEDVTEGKTSESVFSLDGRPVIAVRDTDRARSQFRGWLNSNQRLSSKSTPPTDDIEQPLGMDVKQQTAINHIRQLPCQLLELESTITELGQFDNWLRTVEVGEELGAKGLLRWKGLIGVEAKIIAVILIGAVLGSKGVGLLLPLVLLGIISQIAVLVIASSATYWLQSVTLLLFGLASVGTGIAEGGMALFMLGAIGVYSFNWSKVCVRLAMASKQREPKGFDSATVDRLRIDLDAVERCIIERPSIQLSIFQKSGLLSVDAEEWRGCYLRDGVVLDSLTNRNRMFLRPSDFVIRLPDLWSPTGAQELMVLDATILGTKMAVKLTNEQLERLRIWFGRIQ